MRTIVGVLRGGENKYEASLKTGAEVLQALDRDKYDPRDIFIDRQNMWHQSGVPMFPARALQGVDVVFNVVHGNYGEGGELHKILDSLHVPYTGASAAASILAFNKHHARSVARGLGLKVPYGKVVEQNPNIEEVAFELFRTFPHPAVIKTVSGDLRVVAEDFHSLQNGLERVWQRSPKALLEEMINGKEASVGVIDDFRNEKLYTLFPAEKERVPGLFLPHEKRTLMDAARVIHQGLNLGHYSHSNFVVSKRGVYFIDTHSAAGVGLHGEGQFSKSLHAIGVKLSHFLDHVLSLARRPK
ncbi:hypothetical protein KW798_00120 [Candidatus Parcubacteria bacterium]|nr:hypothetical protein [Candidatus Parcubacteria bacterium]